MTIFPLLTGQIVIQKDKIDFLKIIKAETANGFDLFRIYKKGDINNNKLYESELHQDYFVLRSNPIYDSKTSQFIKTTIYGKVIKKDDKTVVKYWISFNIFTSILFICLITMMTYGLYYNIFTVAHFDLKLTAISLIGYIIFIVMFNSDAKDDKTFIENITRDV